MDKKVVIIGAGGHGRVIAEIVNANDDKVIGFLDDNSGNALGKIEDYVKYPDCYFVVGIGNTDIREEISKLQCKWYKAIHPSAMISPTSKIEEGTVVMPYAVVNAGASIGKHCIINTSAVVEHDDAIGDYSHISVGAKLGGNVSIGKKTWIGIGATVKNNISICDNCMIGAGAVVINDIKNSGTYVGVPAGAIKDEDINFS